MAFRTYCTHHIRILKEKKDKISLQLTDCYKKGLSSCFGFEELDINEFNGRRNNQIFDQDRFNTQILNYNKFVAILWTAYHHCTYQIEALEDLESEEPVFYFSAE